MLQLFNDDCLNILPKLSDKSIDCIIVDPPYQMTSCKWDIMIDIDLLWEQIKRIRKDTTSIIIFSKQPFTTIVNNSNIKEFKYELIWEKQQATNPLCAKKRVMPIHENISIFYKKFGIYNPQMKYGFNNYKSFSSDDKNIGEIYSETKSKHRDCNDGSRYPTSILKFNNVRKAVHPTQKPVELLEWLIKTYTNENDTVLDFCMGSGTTGVACKQLNRNFIGIELDKSYFDIAKERMESHEQKEKEIDKSSEKFE